MSHIQPTATVFDDDGKKIITKLSHKKSTGNRLKGSHDNRIPNHCCTAEPFNNILCGVLKGCDDVSICFISNPDMVHLAA